MKIVKANIAHAEIIGNIHSEAWKQTYENLFPLEYLNRDTADKRKQEFLSTFEEADVQYYLIFLNEKAIGVVKILILDNACEISSIYFLKSYWHKGYGTRTINDIKNLYPQQKIVLWTLEENVKAKNFYEKNDFYATGEKRIIYRGRNYMQIQYEYIR